MAIPGILTDEQLQAMGLAPSPQNIPSPDSGVPGMTQGRGTDAAAPTGPIIPYDPSRPIHTPSGVIDPIVKGGEISKDNTVADRAGLLAQHGLINNDLGKEAFHAGMPKIAEITDDPSSVRAYQVSRQNQLEYKQAHPWGSPVSEHPGILGKIGHVLGEIGSTIAPRIAESIPGSQPNLQAQEQQAEGAINHQTQLGNQTTEANAQKMNAETASQREQFAEDQAANAPDKGKEDPVFDKAGNLIGFSADGKLVGLHNDKLTPSMREMAGLAKPPEKADTATQNKQEFQGIISKLAGEGLPTDPNSLQKSLQRSKSLTPTEKNSASGYLAANPTPSTNLQIHLQENDHSAANARNNKFEGKEVVAYMPDGSRKQMTYGQAQQLGVPDERMVMLSGKEAQDNRDKQTSVDANFAALKEYRNDFKTLSPQLSPLDRDAMRVLTSHAKDGSSAGILGGLFDDIPVLGPVNNVVNKIVSGTITSDQWKSLSPAGKKMVTDYYTTVVSNLANMKATLGTVGRNQAQIQAEMNLVPLPHLDWDSANNAFEQKRADMQRRSGSMPEIYQQSPTK